MMDVYIPTKGRLDREWTYGLVKKAGLRGVLVVEPQEYEEARGMGYDCISIDRDDGGVRYVRNWLLRYFESEGIESAAVIDDDVSAIGCVMDGHRLVYSEENLVRVLDEASRLDGMVTVKAGLDRDMFDVAEDVRLNRGFYCVMVYNCRYLPKGFQIRDDGILEDYEQYIQLVLENGVKVYRLERYFYCTVNCGSNKGGNIYDRDRIEAIKDRCLEMYPEFMRENRNSYYKVTLDNDRFDEYYLNSNR